MAPDRPMVRVLGPLDVVAPFGPLPVPGHHQQALLGSLVVGLGHAVPTDHLTWVLWGDEPPPAAANTLQSYVSQLRHLVGHDAIRPIGRAYELDAGLVDVDARLFEQYARRADAEHDHPDERLDWCRRALGLWRGRPFGDLADAEPFRLEAYRLDELRISTTQVALEAELALGNHDVVAGELEAMVREHPYREHLWQLLIEALRASGRRVEAVRACARLRAVLGEVGMSPGSWLGDIEREVLRGDAGPRPDRS